MGFILKYGAIIHPLITNVSPTCHPLFVRSLLIWYRFDGAQKV